MIDNCLCGSTGGCPICNPLLSPPKFSPATIASMTPKGWECPKCSRIYAPTCMECWTCNTPINYGYIAKKEGQ